MQEDRGIATSSVPRIRDASNISRLVGSLPTCGAKTSTRKTRRLSRLRNRLGWSFPGFQPLRPTLASLRSRRIGLVAADRPADAVTALGWTGAVNVHDDPVLMSTVLRSWEDRWAACVVEIGFDTLTLTVGIPPRDRQRALALAAEHFAFCPDNITQGAGTVAAYAESLRDSPVWTFWWD
ncbi:MAG: DUF4253 domain-containing protein [Chloroflexi bacterium]|nr:MAG: DUF4253 domain-containing protein [Chloroflexota bacterium]